jgi:hypothetical protein
VEDELTARAEAETHVGGSVNRIEVLAPETLGSFLARNAAVLILTKASCRNCRMWELDLERKLQKSERFAAVHFGKLVLDHPGFDEFKRTNPWLRRVASLPYNAIYVRGELRDGYAGEGFGRLGLHLERVLGF